jgi:hypothetical protein
VRRRQKTRPGGLSGQQRNPIIHGGLDSVPPLAEAAQICLARGCAPTPTSDLAPPAEGAVVRVSQRGVGSFSVSLIKRYMEEAEARGWWNAPDKTVCDRHVEDDALERLIAERAEETTCSYCDRTGTEPFAAPLDVLIERIGTSLPHEWANADDEGVPWEGGYVGATYDSYDLLTDALGDIPLNQSELIADVVDSLPQHAWAQRDYIRLRPEDRLSSAWEDFGEIVKHYRRYFFADFRYEDDDDLDYMTPGELLDEIGRAVREAGLVVEFGEGELVYRVRSHARAKGYETAKDLGAPPAERVKNASRMAAAGTPLFYGALDAETAIEESRFTDPELEAWTVGEFRLLRPARIVDLSTEPTVPSLFDEERRHLRAALIFLRHFLEQIKKPFKRDDRIHIDYVPTQVVTEWFRARFEPKGGGRVDGILYGSARSPDGVNLVLFLDNDGAVDAEQGPGDALLELVSHERGEIAAASAPPLSR